MAEGEAGAPRGRGVLRGREEAAAHQPGEGQGEEEGGRGQEGGREQGELFGIAIRNQARASDTRCPRSVMRSARAGSRA